MILTQKLIFVFFTFVNASHFFPWKQPKSEKLCSWSFFSREAEDRIWGICEEFGKDCMKTVVPSCESALETSECHGLRPAQWGQNRSPFSRMDWDGRLPELKELSHWLERWLSSSEHWRIRCSCRGPESWLPCWTLRKSDSLSCFPQSFTHTQNHAQTYTWLERKKLTKEEDES